ncbi:MAG TPA: proline--tRNA ligase [Syntrophomonadaceae bacterium]|nr:proline--tRNA ligase [Syntrophomonadaceae bacterium]HNX28497.1 proline--tRNA ligase [Syntrophomonadaceae bacterium]HPR93069.1 proline--tRNA ligase [Syntrophomonadaceae bacterium]
MKASLLFYPTLRAVPSEAEIVSHQLLLRAGFIRKNTAGVYTYLPLARRVLRKIENIVREEMDKADGQEIIMPVIQPRELWEKSGRWSLYGDEMFKLADRHKREFALGPTHEELITTMVNADVHSYKGLPLLLYQIQNKYRDEIRPRFGLMRGREFIMKDLYSFDVDEAGLDVSYQKMHKAYQQIYDRLNLEYRVVQADSGAIGGNESHEFMVLASSGESEIVYCSLCDYAANVEKAVCSAGENLPGDEEDKPLTKVHTPGQRTINDIVDFLGIPKAEQIKTLMYSADGELIAAVIRGDRELNEIKLKNTLGVNELFMADEAMVKDICGAGFGSLGPVGMPVKIYIDLEVTRMKNIACGANEDDYHYTNVNVGRDFTAYAAVDLRNAVAGDKCPCCGGSLKVIRGIEVGHIFKLGTRYSQAMQATFLDDKGQEHFFVMGCYGIGISRTMAAAVEQNYDENGIIWPLPIAPFQVIIVPVNINQPEQKALAENIYQELKAAGIEVLLDDRDERAGVKFKDADLIGIPLRITIGPKALQENKVEMKKRWEKESVLIDTGEVIETVQNIILK